MYSVQEVKNSKFDAILMAFLMTYLFLMAIAIATLVDEYTGGGGFMSFAFRPLMWSALAFFSLIVHFICYLFTYKDLFSEISKPIKVFVLLSLFTPTPIIGIQIGAIVFIFMFVCVLSILITQFACGTRKTTDSIRIKWLRIAFFLPIIGSIFYSCIGRKQISNQDANIT